MKNFKKVICLLLVLFTLLTSNFGCIKSSWFSEEQHLARVERRIEKKISSGAYRPRDDSEFSEYEGFNVYPLYDQNEELKFILVEFEPYEFAFVRIYDKISLISACVGSMYVFEAHKDWQPYNINKETGEFIYEYDENGEKISYKKSPYYVTGNIDKRKYILKSEYGEDDNYYICAIKEGENFINLLSGKTINIENGDLQKEQASIRIVFYIYPTAFL